MWRIVSSERYSVSSPEVVMTQWTLEDVVDGLAMLNLYQRLEAKVAAKTNGST